jgi:hypothetical protein
MEKEQSFEKSMNSYGSTLRYIPEDSTFQANFTWIDVKISPRSENKRL